MLNKNFFLRSLIIITGLIFPVTELSAQTDYYTESIYTAPSLFVTSGNYSSSRSSLGTDFFLPVTFNSQYTIGAGFSAVTIKEPGWEYKQTLIPVTAGYFSYPWQGRLAYTSLSGNYDYKLLTGYNYKDKGGIISGELHYWKDYDNFGLHYAFHDYSGILNTDSLKGITVQQIQARYEFVIMPELYLSLRPGASLLSDDRNLYFLAAKLHYFPMPELILRTGGFVGKRAYYFDNDTFTLFNQFPTQKSQVYIQAEYYPLLNLKLTAGFQTTQFEGYNINYIYGGVSIPVLF